MANKKGFLVTFNFVFWCILTCIVHVLMVNVAFSQQSNVNNTIQQEYYRRNQLLGNLDSTVSFSNRSVNFSSTERLNQPSLETFGRTIYKSDSSNVVLGILPVSWQHQYTSNPFQSKNDGLMIPAKGYQTSFSAGVFVKAGAFFVQLRPEFMFAENNEYETRKVVYGSTDLPAKFADTRYTQITWGQTAIGVNVGPASLSLSNENLWWGPGVVNSILMSNSAPGFKHISLSTNKPVYTPVGSFEAQIVNGRLDGSGEDDSLPEDWRYLSGLVFSYQPKWIPGLFIGLTRSFQIYNKDMDGSFGDIFPLLQAFQKIKTNEDLKRRDQLTSVFSRLLLPSAKAEVYFEYGLNDHAYNMRDFIMTPEHSRAYLLGMKKLMPYKQRPNEYLEFSAEITHMQQSIDRIVREAGEWYTHSQVLHGYTNRGQLLGAGIGPGSNLQTLSLSWVKELSRLGIELERYEHNGDLANVYNFSPWIDFSFGTVANWTFNKFLLSGKLQGIQSINYQWKDGINGRPKRNLFNINAHVGVMYSF